MFYYKINNDLLEKYQVDFDSEKLRKLCDLIIDDCSSIKHYEYNSDYAPYNLDSGLIRNLVKTNTGRVKEYDMETRYIYHYSYDKYEPPHLVYLVYDLLNNHSEVIDEILNYTIEDTKLSLDSKINSLGQEFNEIDLEDIFKKKEKLQELEKLLKITELNKNQKDIEAYYNQLISLIKFELVDSISISEINKIEEFLETKLIDISIDSKEKQFVKVLKI